MIEASSGERGVYFFGCDAVLRDALDTQGAALGISLHSVQTVAGLMCLTRLQPARVLILQADCLPPGRSLTALLDRLEAQSGRRPRLIVLAPERTAGNAHGAGLGAAGGEAITTFRPPFDAVAIIRQVAHVFAHRPRRLMRLVFVDGRPREGEPLAAALRDEGFEVCRLSEPDRVVATLEAHPADLVLLDLSLPEEATGRLSEALRAHPRLRQLPVIFLAAEGGADRSAPLLRMGQDEYLARPLSPGRLAATVRGRLAREAREARGHRSPAQPQQQVQAPLGAAAPAGDAAVLGWVQSALVGPGFHLVYQPIVSLHRHHERYEALLRLTNPSGEVLLPPTFLPIAARHGLLPPLDRWVLGAGLATLRREREAGRPTRLVVFQSGASLSEPNWLDWLRTEVARLDLIRQRPAVEFSLADILENEDQARLVFPELGRLGIEVCLAGVTDHRDCLGLIARRPIRTAKLARDLIANRDAPRLAALVDALHQRHARVIAAGIETPDAIGFAWRSGVDYVQGHFIQPPHAVLKFRFDEALAA